MKASKRAGGIPWAGLVAGLVAPVLGVIAFYFVQSAEMGGLSPDDYRAMLRDAGILSMILSWSLLANLAVFALAVQFDKWRVAQGVVWATLLYGVVIIALKLS